MSKLCACEEDNMASSSTNVMKDCSLQLSNSSTKKSVVDVTDISKDDVPVVDVLDNPEEEDGVEYSEGVKELMELDEHLEEVVFVSDDADKIHSCFVYDLKTGDQITAFAGRPAVPKAMGVIRDNYLFGAIFGEKVINVWQCCKEADKMGELNVPDFVSAMAVGTIHDICVVAMGKTLGVWEVSNGCLRNKWDTTHRRITCVKFIHGDSHFYTGGTEGNVLMFGISESCDVVLSTPGESKPLYTWTDHCARITDIHTGGLGIFGRVVTAAADFTCRIYEIRSGELLVTLRVPFLITAVVTDFGDFNLYMGTSTGDIHRVFLHDQVTDYSDVKQEDLQRKICYRGHMDEITCLSVSSSGTYLASGSKDMMVRIWSTIKDRCVADIPHFGAITNVFIRDPKNILNDDIGFPDTIVTQFRQVMGENDYPCFFRRQVPTKPSRIWGDDLGTIYRLPSQPPEPPKEEKIEPRTVVKPIIKSKKDLVAVNQQLVSFYLSDPRPILPSDSKLPKKNKRKLATGSNMRR